MLMKLSTLFVWNDCVPACRITNAVDLAVYGNLLLFIQAFSKCGTLFTVSKSPRKRSRRTGRENVSLNPNENGLNFEDNYTRMAPFTREEFEHLFLFRIPLIGISVPFLPPGKGFPGKSGLMESAHVEKQPDESAFPYHFLISKKRAM
jgi:hypothetical protein